MKCISLLMISIGLAGLGLAQLPLQPVVSATKMNVVYRGIPNPIDLAVSGRTWDELTVSVDSIHTLECPRKGSCFLTPSKDLSVHSVKVHVRIDGAPEGDQVLTPAEFRIKRIPDPALHWSGLEANDRYVSRSTMLSFGPVSVRMSGFDFDVRPWIVNFWFGVERQGVFQYFRSEDIWLTPEMKAALLQTQRGDRIWIGNALVSMPDGTDRELPPLLLTLQD
jgi:hypothetical protein